MRFQEIINHRVSITYRRRFADNSSITHFDMSGSGCVRRHPRGFGVTVLTDDGRSIGYFSNNAVITTGAQMGNECARLPGYDGHADMSYDLEVMEEISSINARFNGNISSLNHVYYDSIWEMRRTSRRYNPEMVERIIGVWTIINNSWVDITASVLESMGLETIIAPSYFSCLVTPIALITFREMFRAAFPNVRLYTT
jgi:hypothetical protein